MNTRTLAIVIFLGWSALCWRWYVCRIKQVCESDGVAKTAVEQNPIRSDSGIQAIADSNDTQVSQTPVVSENNSATSQTTKPTTGSKPTPAVESTKPISESKMNEVQMERVQDRMIIHFPYNSPRREDNSAIADYLGRLAEQLIASGQTVSITGHTDFVGEPKDNLQFGLRRALGIRDALVKLGVPSKQIKCYSKGDAKPIATNDTPLGRYKNRRVEIRIGK